MRLRLAAALALFVGSTAGAQTTIDFDDGTLSEFQIVEVGSTYAGLGVTFQNAVFGPSGFPNFGACCAIFRRAVGGDGSVSGSFSTPPTSPIVATFAAPQRSVSVRGLSVGSSGFVLKAFGANGDALGFDAISGAGYGNSNDQTLTVTFDGIRRVEFSQIVDETGFVFIDRDQIAFDDLTFTPSSTVPEPGTWALLGTGLLAVGGIARRRRA